MRDNLGMLTTVLFPGPLSSNFTVTSRQERSYLVAQTEGPLKKVLTVRPSASTLRVNGPCAAHDGRSYDPSPPLALQAPLLLSKSPV